MPDFSVAASGQIPSSLGGTVRGGMLIAAWRRPIGAAGAVPVPNCDGANMALPVRGSLV